MPPGQKKTKHTHKNRSNIVTNSIKTLKMAHSGGKNLFKKVANYIPIKKCKKKKKLQRTADPGSLEILCEEDAADSWVGRLSNQDGNTRFTGNSLWTPHPDFCLHMALLVCMCACACTHMYTPMCIWVSSSPTRTPVTESGVKSRNNRLHPALSSTAWALCSVLRWPG